ncbi:uncharacterized protein A1O5_08311 [Cladophialophora psammophila CBS 110553]|uniref:DUF7492 domain-containing protein n=1 Tax=Cladophialophora psammophila CBS 110553 TaxID=1182543 RepID=W9WKT4_9EURO|nr:uncharacterized protein A1O5_08311 [Cladophialophora psammophila CBS 110553]EXJ68518.1 hypothetical protein A1O5_08311 [Cladophialophora psammophila CBS 110553]
MPIKSIFSSALVGLLATIPLTSAHTWVEQLMVIAPNGTLVGQPGFARGNVLRGTPGFSDPTMVNLIPPDGRPINQIQPSDLMCKSSQTSQTQTDGSPRLQAAAGAGVALRFQENGHVTLPDNQPGKPPNRGTVYVYGTTQASPDDSFLAIHRVWTPDGTGGDGRGRLLSTRNFDDGQCYQVNGGQISQQRQQTYKHPADDLMGQDLWCQQDIQIPADAPSGQPYTLYWVWDWPTLPGTPGFPNGKQEIYTTCMDVDIVDSTGVDSVSKAQVGWEQGQPLDNAAVSAQMTDLANPTAVTGQTIPFTNVPTTFLTQTVSPTPTTPALTSSSTGSTIAFSASATGPVSGGASEASVSAATATETGVPAFLSVHVGSTAGPGIETQTFSVIPIGVFTTTTDAAQSQQSGGRGGEGNNNGKSALPWIFRVLAKWLESLAADSGSSLEPQVTAAPNAAGNVAVATFTEYESVFETVYQTVYQTQYTKRSAGESYYSTASESGDDDYASPTTSGYTHVHTHSHSAHCFWCPSGSAYPKFTHPSGPPPWLSGAWASRTQWPHSHPTGGARQSHGSTEYGGRHGYDNDGSSNYTTTATAESTVTVASTLTLTTYVPSASAAAAVIPVSPLSAVTETTTTQSTVILTSALTLTTYMPSPSASASASGVAGAVAGSVESAPLSSSAQPFPPLPLSSTTDMDSNPAQPTPLPSTSYSSTSTETVTVTVPLASTTSSSSSWPTPSLSNTEGDQPLTFTLVPIPDPSPTPAPAPTVSTDHAVFRLKARNPFVWLGWTTTQKAEATQRPSSSSSSS